MRGEGFDVGAYFRDDLSRAGALYAGDALDQLGGPLHAMRDQVRLDLAVQLLDIFHQRGQVFHGLSDEEPMHSGAHAEICTGAFAALFRHQFP
jgi:hypothetical protein